MDKLIIEVPLNELVPRTLNPHVPITTEEIVRDAVDCANAGASIVHFHARDPVSGVNRPDDVELTAAALAGVCARCDAIFYPTYDISYFPSNPLPAEQTLRHVRALAVHPTAPIELHLFFVGAVNWGRYDDASGAFVEDDVTYLLHGEAAAFLRFCRETGVKPHFGVRELGNLRHVLAYRGLGLVEDPVVCQLRFAESQLWGLPADARGILSYLDVVPPDVPFRWFANHYGVAQHRLNALAIAMGGHVRTGIGSLPAPPTGPETNPRMVERLVRLAREIGREVASPAEARQILGIKRR
jgi:3-keto-5-aminohexanoate cleavage enzyme